MLAKITTVLQVLKILSHTSGHTHTHTHFLINVSNKTYLNTIWRIFIWPVFTLEHTLPKDTAWSVEQMTLRTELPLGGQGN